MICKSIKVLPGHLSRLRRFILSLGTKCLHIPNYHSFTILLQLLSIAISRYSLFLIEKRKCSISLKSVIQFFNYQSKYFFARLVMTENMNCFAKKVAKSFSLKIMGSTYSHCKSIMKKSNYQNDYIAFMITYSFGEKVYII